MAALTESAQVAAFPRAIPTSPKSVGTPFRNKLIPTALTVSFRRRWVFSVPLSGAGLAAIDPPATFDISSGRRELYSAFSTRTLRKRGLFNVGSQPCSNGVKKIFRSCHPLKILRSVISLDPINVVYLSLWKRRLSQKRFSYKTMNPLGFSAYMSVVVAPLSERGLHFYTEISQTGYLRLGAIFNREPNLRCQV